MAAVHRYKRLENSMMLKVKRIAGAAARGIARFFCAIFETLTRRYTIVLVPHSGKKVYNLHISIVSVFCFLFVMAGIVGAFVWYGANYQDTQGRLSYNHSRLQETQASLDTLREELVSLMKKAKGFEGTMTNTFAAIGGETGTRNSGNGAGSGDLSGFFNIKESADGTLKEVEDIRRLGEYLVSLQTPMEKIGTMLDSRSDFLTEIPSIWPIKGGLGRVSMPFGQNLHPFSKQYYIHKGIDLSTYRQGDPIVATADGQIVSVEFDQGGFGNNIIIRHKHGFYTRYAHMLSFRVKAGQRVQQGEIIGFIGNTGLSTGPHLHYEVHIGSDVVDPYKYLNTRANIARNSGAK
ncbi:M23 family metallopeptidase [Breznakiellaceae bacterium SP9]